MTPSALRKLSTSILYTKKSPLFKVRVDMTLGNLMAWEFAKLLVDKGWTWHLMPREIKGREALPPHVATNGPGCWYTLGSTLINSYLLCLHQSRDLHNQFAIAEVPHDSKDAPVKRYQAILAGKPLPPAEPKRERELMLALQPELASDGEALDLQDEVQQGSDDDNNEYGPLAEEVDIDLINAVE